MACHTEAVGVPQLGPSRGKIAQGTLGRAGRACLPGNYRRSSIIPEHLEGFISLGIAEGFSALVWHC